MAKKEPFETTVDIMRDADLILIVRDGQLRVMKNRYLMTRSQLIKLIDIFGVN